MLTDNEILNIVEAEKAEAIGYNDEIGRKREKLLDYYNLQPYGDEIDGRSRFVSSDVSDIVESMVPPLLRIFTQGNKAFQFHADNVESEEEARQKEDLVNYVFYRQNQGVLVLNNMFKDALLQYTGVVKVCWKEEPQVSEERYEGLSQEELNALEFEEDAEIEEVEQKVQIFDGPQGPFQSSTFNARIKRTKTIGKVKYENVPPEEFLISRTARDFVDPIMVGHKTPKTRSQLIQMGFDKDIVNSLPAFEKEGDGDSQRAARYHDYDDSDYSNPSMHKANDVVMLTEMYIKIDVDEDGITELWQIFEAGNKILEKTLWDEHPFAVVTPVPLPHRAIGTCPADQVADIQFVKSTLVRHALDNIYTSNYNRFAANDRVNFEDLLTPRPGGIVRIDGTGPIGDSLFPIPSTPQVDQILQQIEYVDSSSERRTGFTRFSQGLDGDALNHTATGFRGISANGRERVELIARIFAETGVKELGRKTAMLLTKYQNDKVQVRISGRRLEVNPGKWRHNLDCIVDTGIGSGDKAEKLANLNVLLERQIQAKQLGSQITDEAKIYNTLEKIVHEIGLNSATEFWNNPEQPEQLLQAENEQLKIMVQSLQEQAQQNPLAEAELIKAQARMAEVNQRDTLKAQEMQAKQQLELLKLAQQDEHFRQELIRDLTKMELDSGKNVPGAAV